MVYVVENITVKLGLESGHVVIMTVLCFCFAEEKLLTCDC